MSPVYINGMGNISPQKSFATDSFLEDVVETKGPKLTCLEPDYASWIDPKSIRRMSRIIRMGVASALLALKEASLKLPDAIITGTGYGCLEDTGIFLSKMIVNQEQSLNPTPFIQSTHNSIGSQIGMLLQCFGYNQTYVQGAFSLENSLLDAQMMLDEKKDQNVLVGGVDEITEISHAILRRFGLFRQGAKQGEGSAYFLLSAREKENSYAKIKGVAMLYDHQSAIEIKLEIIKFLDDQNLKPNEVDMILLGASGDARFDKIGKAVTQDLWGRSVIGSYKQLCGEYPTSTGFAIWLGASILKKQQVPHVVAPGASTSIKNILIYNPYFGKNHSLILMQAC